MYIEGMRKILASASAAIAIVSMSAAPLTDAVAAQPQVLPAVLTFHVPVTVADAKVWAEATLAGADVTLPANVSLLFSDVANCGADLSVEGLGGCTYTLTDSTVIVLSPGLAYSEAGSHILFHEVAHSMGIMGECEAEAFAHSFEDVPYWSYPDCK